MTKTTTVTETQVITEFPGNKKETVTIVNGSASSHNISASDEKKETPPPPTVETQAPVTVAKVEQAKPAVQSPTSPSEHSSSPDISTSETIKSPSKVKKSKSFKNMFGKKKDKKEK